MTNSSGRSAAHRDFSGSMFCRNTHTHTFMSIAVYYHVRDEMTGKRLPCKRVGIVWRTTENDDGKNLRARNRCKSKA